MIDIHTHILPGLDDGASNLHEAIAMLRKAEADGITAVVATPHILPGVYPNNRERIITATEELKAAAKKAGLKVEIFPGAEYYLSPELLNLARRGELLTIGGNSRYLLVELPHTEIPAWTELILSQLLQAGYIPILAHPEKQRQLAMDNELTARLIDLGVGLQITASSLTGSFGRTARHAAWYFLQQGWIIAVASDAHSPRNRPLVLSNAFIEVARRFGENTSTRLFINNPAAIIGRSVIYNCSSSFDLSSLNPTLREESAPNDCSKPHFQAVKANRAANLWQKLKNRFYKF